MDKSLPSPSLYIQLLGTFQVLFQSEALPALNTPRLQSLLTYLVLYGSEPQSRRHVAFQLWPDSNEKQALTNLRKSLKFLREALPQTENWINADRHTIGWTNPTSVHSDVAQFQQALNSIPADNNQNALVALRRALELYKGELMPGCYEEWILPLREKLHSQYFAALEHLITLLEGARSYDDAIQASQQLLRLDPLHEPTYRRLIRLYALKEDRANALCTYHTCVTQLREELGVDPDEETQAIYERLLNGNSTPLAQPELAAHAPFVGREAEWKKLQQRWQMALRGHPQFALIAGEAGIGKTRLAEELLSWATHQGFCTVRSRCYAAEGRLTYAPVIEWLRSERLRPQRSKVAATWLTELSRLLPEILSEQPELPAPEPITQSAQRHHLFEAVTRVLLAGEQPLILLIDDLQWCDKETLELLHFLLRNAANLSQSKLMFVGTARLPDEVDATHPLYDLLNPLRGSDSLIQLDLVRLNEVETGNLARQMTAQQLDERTLNQLFSDTAGNPLFVVETMRATQGAIAHNGSPESTTAMILPIEMSESIVQHLPPKVLATIQSRLAQLSPVARELCDWAAIVGRAFTLDLLVSASKVAQDKAVNALDELWQRRLIREQGSDAYDFSHDRIRDVAAAGVSRVRRKYLHRCVAEALEEMNMGQTDRIAAQIAAHYDEAGVLEKAIRYYERAAKHAPQIYASYEAAPYLQRAIVLLKIMPETMERDQRELTLLTALGPALATVAPDATSLISDIYIQAAALSQRLNITLHPSFSRIFAIHRVGHQDYAQALSVGQQLLRLADEQTTNIEKLAYVEGCYVLGIKNFLQGHFEQAKHHLQQAADHHTLLQKPYNSIEYAQDIGITSNVRLGWNLWYLGFPDQARQRCEMAMLTANQLNHPLTKSVVLGYATAYACTCRNVIGAEITYQRSFDAPLNVDRPRALEDFYIGWIKLLRGEIFEGTQQLLKYATCALEINPHGTYLPHQISIVCEALQQSGNFEQGLDFLTVAFSLLNGNQDYWYIADMHRVKGELLLGQGNYYEARSNFHQALEISRRQQAKSLELRAAMSMARLWDSQGKRAEARELLTGVYNWFTEGFDTADLQDAKALLEKFM